MTLTAKIDHAAPMSVKLASGERGTEQTVELMRELVIDAAEGGSVKLLRNSVLRAYAADFAEGVFDLIRLNVAFERDPRGVEYLRHPDQLIAEMAKGTARADCDDITMLACALLTAAGIQATIIVVARQHAGPWEHVLAGYRQVDGQVVPLD
ncbi:MAG: hypothetical protein AAFP26_08965, partial [Planctomycetota bacterium]